MKKPLIISLVSLGLVSGSVFAENYQTSKHNIRITCHSDNNCTYQSWNKPKQIGQGKPDLEIRNGNFQSVNINSGACSVGNYGFQKGNLVIIIGWGLNRSDKECFVKPPPKNVNGELTVYINRKKKDHYWVY